MKQILVLITLIEFVGVNLFCWTALAGSPNSTKTGIRLDTKWKQQVYSFAEQNVRHSIWGIAHSERNYQFAVDLASHEKLSIDKDILFAAAFLHDIGAIEPFRIQGVEHATRSVQVMEPLLKSFGLSDEKISKVREAILGHMYNAELIPEGLEAVLFHDADTLDFLGSIGLVRIVGLTDRHAWAPTLPGAIETLQGWTEELPRKLITQSAKVIAKKRIAELKGVMTSLQQYTFSGAAL